MVLFFFFFFFLTLSVSEFSFYDYISHFLQVHCLMCLELKKFVDRISKILPDIESARPRCTSGIKAQCSLHAAMEKAKLFFQYCSESSRLYLVRISLI